MDPFLKYFECCANSCFIKAVIAYNFSKIDVKLGYSIQSNALTYTYRIKNMVPFYKKESKYQLVL